MIREIKTHPIAYSTLVIALAVGVFLFLAAWPNRATQRFVALGIGSFYAIWGIITHLKSDNITQSVLLEYMTIGALATVLLGLITF